MRPKGGRPAGTNTVISSPCDMSYDVSCCVMPVCLLQPRRHTVQHQCHCSARWEVPSDRLLVLQMWRLATISTFLVLVYIQIKSLIIITSHLYFLLNASYFGKSGTTHNIIETSIVINNNKQCKMFNLCTFYSCHSFQFVLQSCSVELTWHYTVQ